MLKLRYSKQFKKDFKLSQKRGLPMQKLKTILEKLVNGIPLLFMAARTAASTVSIAVKVPLAIVIIRLITLLLKGKSSDVSIFFKSATE